MKSRWITVALCLVAVVVLMVRIIPHGRRRNEAGSSRAARSGSPNPYLGLRSLVLEGTRANFGLGPGKSSTQPFAVVSDWGENASVGASGEGTTTIIAVADGSASVYRGNGPALIGGGQAHPSIRNAALKAIDAAAAVQAQMQRTSEYPLPGPGKVSFYVVTDAGVFAATAARDEVMSKGSALSALAAALQEIVSEYQRVGAGH